MVSDIMFVNTIPFLITYTRRLKFGTVEVLTNRKSQTIATALKHAVRMYTHRGFRIDTLFADPEFEELRSSFPMLNTCGADDHIPDIE